MRNYRMRRAVPRRAGFFCRIRALAAAQRRISVLLPNSDSIRSTASSAVLLRTSSAGFSSMTSSEAEPARVGDHLHAQLRFAIGRAARHGRADAGRDLRIEEVDVEADVQVRVRHPDPRARAPSCAARPSRRCSACRTLRAPARARSASRRQSTLRMPICADPLRIDRRRRRRRSRSVPAGRSRTGTRPACRACCRSATARWC